MRINDVAHTGFIVKGSEEHGPRWARRIGGSEDRMVGGRKDWEEMRVSRSKGMESTEGKEGINE